jgi:hypothetical protein
LIEITIDYFVTGHPHPESFEDVRLLTGVLEIKETIPCPCRGGIYYHRERFTVLDVSVVFFGSGYGRHQKPML